MYSEVDENAFSNSQACRRLHITVTIFHSLKLSSQKSNMAEGTKRRYNWGSTMWRISPRELEAEHNSCFGTIADRSIIHAVPLLPSMLGKTTWSRRHLLLDTMLTFLYTFFWSCIIRHVECSRSDKATKMLGLRSKTGTSSSHQHDMREDSQREAYS